MSRYKGPRLRIIRRLGKLSALTEKTSKRIGLPGQHGLSSSRKLSQYGIRLKEKQKLRFYYSVTERQLLNYLKKARKKKGSSGKILLSFLEMRLDNIVFRLGICPTIISARQLITHGHIVVNGKKVNLPSFSCKPTDLLAIKNSSTSRNLVKKNLEISRNILIPSHLKFNNESLEGSILSVVSFENVGLILNELLVVEYYSLRI